MAYVLSKWFLVTYVAATLTLGTILWGYLKKSGPSDSVAPTISSVTASAGTYYFVGRTLSFTVNFDEAVVVTGTPRIAVTIGSNTRYATYASGSGTTALVFSYTFVTGDSDTDGFAATSPIDLNSGTIKDAAGNDATLTFSAPSLSSKRAVLSGLTAGTDFQQGADAQVLYSSIDGTTITATNGTRGSTSGSDSDDPSFSAHGATFDGADRFTAVPYASGLSDYVDTTMVFSIHAHVYHVGGNRCVVWSSINNAASQGSYFAVLGDLNYIYFVNVNNVGGTYRLAWTDPGTGWYTFSAVGNGTTIKFYVNGVQVSGTATAATVTAQTTPSNNEIGHAYNLNSYNSSGEKMRVLACCNVAHTDAEAAANHTFLAALNGIINGDTTGPTVSSAFFSNQPGGEYDSSVGTLNLDVAFTEAVTVTGTPRITIDSDTAADGFPKNLNYTSGSGTTTLRFAYAVDSLDDSGGSPINVPNTSALALNGGTIKDQYGNNATLTLPGGLTVKVGGNNGGDIIIIPG